MGPWNEGTAAAKRAPAPQTARRSWASDPPEPPVGDGQLPHDIVWEVAARPPAEGLSIRLVNLAVAAASLAVLSPLMLLIAIAIKLDSRGPVLYRQLRIGLDRRSLFGENGDGWSGRRTGDLGGRPFMMYKFRTMRLHAEEETGPVWASPEDDRSTRVGRFLRRYRLDEIPQFLNVLRGEMCVVGPRPERPSFVRFLREQFEEYPLRQRVPPGITGWAQVHQEADRCLDDVRMKLRYDLEYLRCRSTAFDLRIMMRTLPVILEGERNGPPR